MNRLPPIFVIAFFFLSSCAKKESVIITPANLDSVLTQYGKENPENEVMIETDHGTIRLKLYDDVPLHRANFVKLIRKDIMTKADFYRIASQIHDSGRRSEQEAQLPDPGRIQREYFHKRGALSMARTDNENPHKESSSTEFFIVQGERYADWDIDQQAKELGLRLTPEQRQVYLTQGGYLSLDQQYTVFGEVTEGIEVVDKIASVKVYNEDKPVTKIPMKISLVQR